MRHAPAAGFGLVAAIALAFAVSPAGRAQEKSSYVGDKSCMKCHFKQHKSWKKTPLADSMKTLEPTKEADDKALFDRKKAAGLDPATDYTTDAKCLKCHTTGYGQEGGYPAKVDADNAKQAKAMGAVSCEACHGAGSRYVDYKNAKRKEDKEAKFTTEELLKYGLVKPDEANCKSCHNKDNPTNATDDFKFEDAKTKVHDH